MRVKTVFSVVSALVAFTLTGATSYAQGGNTTANDSAASAPKHSPSQTKPHKAKKVPNAKAAADSVSPGGTDDAKGGQ
ncbi:hypothetical protein AWB75_06973 [Caballeronia catudaia]|uniref:Uncharacterized protein n=1 Tax=Caballeronia catudaia TaxID=1777136 RepID=A0A158DMY0_9BURK|nr:hypothetical protein [Caballeronia catudaia]SAK96001.1 hypothetical protein AWB75_06973 [Caballeronia catudaia]